MKNDVTYDAGSAKDVGKKVKGTKLRKLGQDEDLRTTLSHYQSRATLWRLLEQCGVYRLSFSGDGLDTAFREGQRHIGLWLLAEIHAVDPNAYPQMQQEAIKRKQEGH